MHLLNLIRRELFFTGIDEKDFRQVKSAVAEGNRKSLVSWSISVGIFWLLSLLLSLRSPDYARCRTVYIGALGASLFTLFCGAYAIKRFPRLLAPAMYLLQMSVLGAGIGIALFQPDVRTVTMIAVVIIIPSSFIDRTAVSILQLLITIAVYAILGNGVIDPPIYSWSLLNLTIFSVAGILIGHVINKSRYERYVYTDSARKLAEIEANYNAELQKEVAAKTDRIIALHDKLIIGMATMMESRDHSTGGHIRRTSEGVRILVETIQEDGSLHLTPEFCEKIIKAAPMHDLGKIVTNDAILRKPGRYTSEEYDEMKIHAAEGARILNEILIDTDDEEFRQIAENVAHYHHEHMDGTGYPEGLKGEEIPIEARIVAIADVYDALVSDRPYKDGLPFEMANQIILDGMGTQFDPALKKFFVAARPRLEAYYARAMAK